MSYKEKKAIAGANMSGDPQTTRSEHGAHFTRLLEDIGGMDLNHFSKTMSHRMEDLILM